MIGSAVSEPAPRRSSRLGFLGGAAVGGLGGLIGLGGAEFRLPLIASFARYSRDSSFAVLDENTGVFAVMAAGAVLGSLVGGTRLGLIPAAVLLPVLSAVLLISALKVWRHR